ncbi:hypothetical protein M9Y10_011431 [Tritrichomonas musculus]|uniref:Uncharacterized protein n=1 Tax=Tritrichomonas musculus TaxID=1915356 RepID=A0ABR2IJD1_9EUKA
MKKVSINKDKNEYSKLNERISNTEMKIEEHLLSLSEREKEIRNKQYEIERLALLSKEKESIISLYENELEKHKEKIDKDFSNSRVEYYALNKEIIEEEEKQNNKIKDLEEKIKLVYLQKDKLNKLSSDFHQQLIQLSLSDERASTDRSKVNDIVNYLKDTEFINSYSERFYEQVKKVETDLSAVKQKVSEQELQNVQMQLNLAQTKSDIANLQKEEVSLRIKFLNQEQKNVSYEQKLTAKIKSSSLIEIKYKKLKKIHKKSHLKLNLKIPRLKKQLNTVEISLQDHLDKINSTKTDLQNNKSDIKYVKEQETRFKADSLIITKRMKRKTSKYPDELIEVQKEKNKVRSKLEKKKQKYEEKQSLIESLQRKVETLDSKLKISEKCQKLITEAESDFNIKVEQQELDNKMKFSLFQEDLAQLKKINQKIAEQERTYHQLDAQLYKTRDDLIDQSIKRQFRIKEKEKFNSKTKSELNKEKSKIQEIKDKIDKVNLDIYNNTRLLSDVKTNFQHLIGINQYLEVHKTIATKENELEVIERTQKMKRKIYELEKKIEQKKISNETRRSFINKLSTNYFNVANTYGIRQDSNNIIIYPTESFSWIESYFAKMKKVLFSIQTEIKFWNQKCPIPQETLLRQWYDKVNA